MDYSIISAIITAIGVIVAALVGRKLYKHRILNKASGHTAPSSTVRVRDIRASGDVIVSGRDTVLSSHNKDRMTDSDKNLFSLGYYHGNIVTRIICPFPKEQLSIDKKMRFALNGLLERIQFQSRAEYLGKLTNLLCKVDGGVSIGEKKITLSKMNELLTPLRTHIKNQYAGRGNASFILGMNLPQLSRCLTMFKVIDNARTKSESALLEQVEKLWDEVRDMLYDIHIDKLRKLVLFEELPTELKRSLNCIVSADIRQDRREMQRELASIGSFYDMPVFSSG